MSHYFLTPHAPMHIGEFIGIEREAALDYIPSDTLFSAFVTAWAQCKQNIGERVEQCQQDSMCLKLSSAFPRAQEILFYPMPLGLKLNWDTSAPDLKQLKRIRWVSEKIFNLILNYGSLKNEFSSNNLIHEGSVWLSKTEYSTLQKNVPRSNDGLFRLWTFAPQEMIVPRVTVDRASNSPNLFHSGRVTFAKDCGLWFAAHTTNHIWIEEALNVLKDSGLGGLRSTGHGAFDWTCIQEELPCHNYDYGVLLSRFAPQNADEVNKYLLDKQSAYRFVTVGGWCQDDTGKAWRRKRLRMLAEGACLPSGAIGYIVNVSPDNVMTRAVYRNGLALQVGISPRAMYA